MYSEPQLASHSKEDIMKYLLFSFFMLFALALTAETLSAQVLVVAANESVGDVKLSKDNLFKILVQDQQYWDASDDMIQIVDYAKGGIKNAFFNKLGKEAAYFEQVWAKNKFNGIGQPPVLKNSELEVAQFIKNTPGALGYMTLQMAMSNNLKVVFQF